MGSNTKNTESKLVEVQGKVSTVGDDFGEQKGSSLSRSTGGFIKCKGRTPVQREIYESFILLTSFMEMLTSFSNRSWHLLSLPKAPKFDSVTVVILTEIFNKKKSSRFPHDRAGFWC